MSKPPSVLDGAPSARDDTIVAPFATTPTAEDPASGPQAPDTGPTADRAMPAMRIDDARVDAPAPRRDLSPAQALDLVRRASERADRHRDPDHEPGPTT